MEHLKGKTELKERLKETRGVDVDLCYQCAKCTNGCPSSEYMDIPPHKVVRMVQLGFEKVFEASSPWFCVFCLTCSVRCPNGIEVAKVMDFVKEESIRRGFADRESELFHRLFLENVEGRGRISEASFMARFVMRTGRLCREMPWALKSLFKGKIKLFPSKTRDTSHIEKVFKRCGL